MAKSLDETLKQPPVIFTARGLEVDTCLRVFDQEFHVHSTILKLGSAFFHAFLDSPEKFSHKGKEVAANRFKYDWVTEIDDDRTGWFLVESKGAEHTQNSNAFEFDGDAQIETETFNIILSAIYGEPYMIECAGGMYTLGKVVDMADYYRALPAVSKTLSYDSLKNILIDSIGAETSDITALLRASHKLRHRDLFETTMISLAGNCGLSISELGVEEFSDLAIHIRNRIMLEVAEVHKFLFRLFTNDRAYIRLVDDVSKQMIKNGEFELPEYYRLLHEGSWSLNDNVYQIRAIIDPLVENKQKIIHTNIVRGTYYYDYCFLCGEVKDEEIPWDLTQKDW